MHALTEISASKSVEVGNRETARCTVILHRHNKIGALATLSTSPSGTSKAWLLSPHATKVQRFGFHQLKSTTNLQHSHGSPQFQHIPTASLNKCRSSCLSCSQRTWSCHIPKAELTVTSADLGTIIPGRGWKQRNRRNTSDFLEVLHPVYSWSLLMSFTIGPRAWKQPGVGTRCSMV